MSNDKRIARKRRNVGWLVGLGALVIALGGGLWFWSGSRGDARAVDGPVDAAPQVAPLESAALESAKEIQREPTESSERVALAPETQAESKEEVEDEPILPAGTGSISGNFLRPASLPRDAIVTLHAVARIEGPDADTFGPLALELPVSEGWKLTDLGPGTYRVKASAEIELYQWSSEFVELTLRDGAQLTGINLNLVEFGVEGFVLTRNGIGVAGVSVEVIWMDQDDEFEFPSPIEIALGMGKFVTLSEGEALSSLSALGYGSMPEPVVVRSALTLPDGEGFSEIEALVQGANFSWGTVLKGAIVESREASESGTTITIPQLDPEFLSELGGEVRFGDHLPTWGIRSEPIEQDVEVEEQPVQLTDASGRFSLPLPGPGRYGLHVDGHEVEVIATNQSIEVNFSQPMAALNFEVVRAARLSGRVTAFSGEVPDGIDCFLRLNGNTDTESVNAEGEYSFEHLWPGLYDFYARGGGDSGQDFSHHVRLQIDEGEDVEYDALLNPSFTVHGQLAGGEGLYANLELEAFGTTNPSLSRRATVNIDGSFTIKGLYPGEYRLHARHRQVEGEYGLAEEVIFFVDVDNAPAFQTATLQREAE